MTFQRAPPPEKTVARSDIPLGLPFKGEWFVFWGGDTEAQNHHVGVPDQRRAADLMIVDADGKSHRTDGKTNADFLVYGQPVLAVADGTVLTEHPRTCPARRTTTSSLETTWSSVTGPRSSRRTCTSSPARSA
jgi:hypothetical protein